MNKIIFDVSYTQASAREASNVEAFPEARRGSMAVVETGDSPDPLQYNSRDQKKGLDDHTENG